jgi:4a-hydroxytetrahydrobiopterin dehydratase
MNPTKLTDGQVSERLSKLNGWERTAAGEIAKTFNFKNYHETMAFVNASAWVSHREDHHPDLEVGYNKCRVRYSTHSVGGLSENDFISAAKIEALFAI